MNFKEINKMY